MKNKYTTHSLVITSLTAIAVFVAFQLVSVLVHAATTIPASVQALIYNRVITEQSTSSYIASHSDSQNSEESVQSSSSASSTASNEVSVSSSSASIPNPTSSLTASSSVSTQSTQNTSRPLSASSSSSQNASEIIKTNTNFFVDWERKIHTIAAMKGTPTAIWLTGEQYDISTVQDIIASRNNLTPVFVLYNIPYRDCGLYSAGGVGTKQQYMSWLNSITKAVGTAPSWFVIEPDALANLDCMNTIQQNERYSIISDTVTILKKNPNTRVYIDAGNANWVESAAMVERLKKANISQADGFSLNVSNFVNTSNTMAYGMKISDQTGSKKFIIDTSRNGNGANGEWCNPPGRAIGQFPTKQTGNNRVDAFLWIKIPGESDGECNGGPAAGVWWQAYAESLVNNRKN